MSSTIEERLEKIEERLENLEKRVLTRGPKTGVGSMSIKIEDMLALSDSLQKTMIAIQELDEATTNEVAEKTGRSRSVETIYLNQLTRLGYVNKERRGRKIYFKVLKYY